MVTFTDQRPLGLLTVLVLPGTGSQLANGCEAFVCERM